MMLWTKLLIEQGDVPEHMAEGLEAIEKCAIEQQTLIEDIVDTSRIVAGKLRLEPKTMDLTRMVRSAVEAIRPAAVTKLVTMSDVPTAALSWKTPSVTRPLRRVL